MIIATSHSTDFKIGTDSFDDLEINSVVDGPLYYFKNTQATLVKRFILKRTDRSQKHCTVTLVKKPNGKFEPRFNFEIFDLSKKAVESLEVPITEQEIKLIKAKVDLGDCHEELSQLLAFIGTFENIELSTDSYAVVSRDQKARLGKILGSIGKEAAVDELGQKFGKNITEKDISVLTGRKDTLNAFRKLLAEAQYFQGCKAKLGPNKRDEDVWQYFFEKNTWIFGYGLQLISCESLNDNKLEAIVVGNDIFSGAGKRSDALLKTRGKISKIMFGEIKIHTTELMKDYPRPGVFVPSKDLQGAVGQVQKTIHKVSLMIGENFRKITDANGNPSGEELAVVRPKGLIVIGRLDEFFTDNGINQEQFSSFELYRQQIEGIDILTFDELYERTRFIVEE